VFAVSKRYRMDLQPWSRISQDDYARASHDHPQNTILAGF